MGAWRKTTEVNFGRKNAKILNVQLQKRLTLHKRQILPCPTDFLIAPLVPPTFCMARYSHFSHFHFGVVWRIFSSLNNHGRLEQLFIETLPSHHPITLSMKLLVAKANSCKDAMHKSLGSRCTYHKVAK